MAEKIYISNFNESFIQIDSEQGILQEISSKFSFLVPGAAFIPSVREKRWDGILRLFGQGGPRTLFKGLHRYVKEFAEQEGYECIYRDPIDVETEFSVIEAHKMFAALKLTSHGNPIQVRDHQERAIIHAIQSKRSLLLSPTSSGKSLIIYCLLRYYQAITRGKILIIVPSVGLVKQLYDDFADYSAQDERWDVEDNVHKIHSGEEKHSHKRIYLSTWQSLQKLPRNYFHQFSAVFSDEVHLSSSKETSNILSKLINARYRHGTTGTLKEAKTNQMVLEGLFGPVYKTITTKQLMDQGTVAKLDIKCLQLEYTREDRKLMKKATYQDEVDFLITHIDRNRLIRNLALSLEGNVLMMYQFVEKHGKVLHKMLLDKNDEERPIFFVSGQTDADVRNEIRAIVEKETRAIIIASYGVFSTGVSIKNIDFVILTSPSKSKIRVLQTIGRGLRVSERKKSCILYDIADDLSLYTKSGNVSWENYSLLHFLERINFYNQEQFDYKIYKIELRPN